MTKKNLLRRSLVGVTALAAAGAISIATTIPASADTITPYSSRIDIGGGYAHLYATLTFTGVNSFKATVQLCDEKSGKDAEFDAYSNIRRYAHGKYSGGADTCSDAVDVPYSTDQTIPYVQFHVYACSPDGSSCTHGEYSVQHDNPYA